MIGRLPSRRLLRRKAAHAALALAVLSAVPGVAVASLPAPPPPTHECCAPDAPPMHGPCGTAPCCVTKPAPKGSAVLTSGLPAPAIAFEKANLLPVPALDAAPKRAASVLPRARSAPLFLLFVSFLN